MLPIYKLTINDEDLETGVEFISLVENPAIEKDFLKFDKFESFNDYPEAAKQNAERGIRLNEELGNKCATQVGKVRGQQIANGEPLSEETITRTYSYLSRAKEYYNPDDKEACGTISYLLWGGEEMLRWCESKMAKFKKQFAIQNEEKRIISGAAMLADLPIYRRDDMRGEYYVVFDKETIYKIAKKWALNNKYNAVNVDHSTAINGCTLFESYLLDFERGIMPPKGFEDAKDGSWFVSYIVEDDSIWAKCKDGTWNGFSVEGYFDFVEPKSEEDKLLEDLKSLLSKWNGK
jgi:hypothetical protein